MSSATYTMSYSICYEGRDRTFQRIIWYVCIPFGPRRNSLKSLVPFLWCTGEHKVTKSSMVSIGEYYDTNERH